MSWALFAAADLVAAAWLLVPGAALGRLLGLRGLLLAAVAPAVSVGVLVLASLLLGAVRIPSGPPSLLVVAALCCLAAWPLSRMLRRVEARRRTAASAAPVPDTAGRRIRPAVVIGVVVGAALLTGELVAAFGAPGRISQHFDVVFHLNAVRFILDTGDASPLVLGTLNGGSGANAFYPSAWHALTALLVQVTGAGIPLAANAASAAVAAVAWTLGCVGLTRVIAGPRAVPLLLAGVFSAGLGQFPLLLLDWGVLYANFIGVAVLPAVLALVLVLLRPAEAGMPRVVVGAVALPALLGLMGAHPSSLAALAVLALPQALVTQWTWFARRRDAARGTRASTARMLLPHIAVLVATAGVLVALAVGLRPPNGFPGWDPTMGIRRALLGVLAGSVTSGTPPLLVGACILVGVVVAIRSRRRAVVAGYAIVMGLFVVAAVVPRSSPLRALLVGAWYQDVYRVAALTAVLAVPLAATGGAWLVERGAAVLVRRWPRVRSEVTSPIRAAAALAALALVAGAGLLWPHVLRQVAIAHRGYVADASSPLITPAEAGFLQRLPREVPAAAVIADDPWDGSGFAYALGDRRVVAPHLLMTFSPDQALVVRGLRDAQRDPAVCAAAARLHVGYALDLGRPMDGVPGAAEYPGLMDLGSSDAVALVTAEGDARLYRLLPCRS